MEDEEDDDTDDRKKLDETIHYLNTLDDEKTSRLNTATEEPGDMQNILSTLKSEINEEEEKKELFVDSTMVTLGQEKGPQSPPPIEKEEQTQPQTESKALE